MFLFKLKLRNVKCTLRAFSSLALGNKVSEIKNKTKHQVSCKGNLLLALGISAKFWKLWNKTAAQWAENGDQAAIDIKLS